MSREQQDEIEDLEPESSAGPEKDVAPQAQAESSTAEDVKPEDDLLSVVRDAVKKSASDAASSAEVEDENEAETPSSPDDEDFTDVPFHKHPRFTKLVRDKRKAEKEAAQLPQLIREKEEAEKDAVQYRQVQSFMSEHGLVADEAAEALIVAGLAKTDPVAAWARIKPWVQKLLVAAGEVVPDGLAQRVQTGELTQSAALEIAKANAQVQAVEAQRALARQQQQEREAREASDALTRAAVSWEAERQAKDPNFGAKMDSLVREIAYLHTVEGKPTTPEGVRAQLTKAYAAVNKQAPVVQAPVAQRPAVRPVTGGQTSGPPRAKSDSLLDIIEANRRRG